MRRSLLALFFALAAPLLAQTSLVDQGIALYDAGKYDDALAKVRAALEQNPADDLAAYELAVAKKGRYRAPFLAILGNCLNGTGDTDAAIKPYRRGLKIAPDDTQQLYNLAVPHRGLPRVRQKTGHRRYDAEDPDRAFTQVAKANPLETFSAIALVSLGLDGTKGWVDVHGEDIRKYSAFMQQQAGR
jgi:tetratricopeptide (TPR) repeat protein